MAREDIARAQLADELLNTVQYRGSDLYAQFVRLLDRIEACYCEEMLTVSVDQLRYKQGAAAQVRVLRNLLVDARTDAITDLPKV